MARGRLRPASQRAKADFKSSTKTEHGEQSFIGTPLLLGREVPDETSETAGVDGADLLHKDSGRFSTHVYLWSE